MKEKTVKLSMFTAACLLAGVVSAATGLSNEFLLDLRGMGPWERRVAKPTETITYSSGWNNSLVHRWSFDGDLDDSVGGARAVAVGNVSVGNGVCTLSGGENGTSYISLGSDILPRDSDGVTLEIWATQNAVQRWSRVFDIGAQADLDEVLMTWSSGEVGSENVVCVREISSKEYGDLGGFSLGVEYHISVVFKRQANGTWTVSCEKRAADTGRLLASSLHTSEGTNWTLPDQIQTDCWLGHSHFISDHDASASYNEIRVWRKAFTDEELEMSARLGPNALFDCKANVRVYQCLREKPKYIAIDLSGGTNATRYPIEYFDEIPGGSWSDEYKTSKLVLRHIPAGSFIMGGRNTDYPGAVNTNLHMVTLTRDFYMGVFEVTQRQWELVMGNRPSCFTNEMCYATRPVDSVNYAMIRGTDLGSLWPESAVVDEGSFIGIMRRKTSVGLFDLPTEAQWEYACRAGTTTALSSGRDLTVNDKNSDSLDVARSANNGGVDWGVTLWAAQHSDATDEIGTAKVGSYAPNGFGLYDCHGNVFEVCLDRFQDSQEGCVDPVGPTRTVGPVHVMRGGSWINNAGGLRSAHRESDALRTSPAILGLRLCLQGGEVCGPDAQTLVEAAGSATVIWTPTRAGTYCLTHQVQKDGASLGAKYSALFEVNGPTLSLSANGELEPGVGIEVKVKGEGEQWNVYYTLDGSEPTAASTVYSGAITLNETTTVRAVAINAQGVRSEEALATFTLHDALGIASAVAIPRYPWNGKVDVDVELKGNPEAQYLVELVARDLAGGTNLPVRTVYHDASLIPDPYTLIPAKHRLTWDAAADIAGDFDFNRVAVTVKATGSHLLAYPKTLELTVAGYAGAETLAEVPTLVRLSTAIEGFSYADFATTNGTDLAFFSPEGLSLPYEIDEWNVGGESLVWVKLPELKKGTKFVAAWGKSADAVDSTAFGGTGESSSHAMGTIASTKSSSTEVWREYAGVWHMNEASGTAFDSTEHHLDGIPSCGTNELADVSQMVAYEDGACGRARVNATSEMIQGTFMTVPAYAALNIGSRFSIEGWFHGVVLEKPDPQVRLFSTKYSWTDLDGWECGVSKDSQLEARGSDTSALGWSKVYFKENWCKVLLLFDGEAVACYVNGVRRDDGFVVHGDGKIAPVKDTGRCLLLGNRESGRSPSFNGQYDEIRLRGGSLSADRIKADYDMIVNRKFLSYGVVAGEQEIRKNE